ncbi:Polysaccharide biosynthesis protein [uncultured archaeon]|nr:Polysaccharide biosynthesis protein [uncultured archaeon]
MNTTRRVAKNVLILTISDLINKVLSLLLVVYIARYLGDVDFGKYSFAFAFSNFFLIFADIGLSTLIIRDIARNKMQAGKYLGNILIIKSVLGVIVLGSILSTITVMGYPFDTAIVVYIVGFSLILGSMAGSFQSIFIAYEEMEYPAIITIVGRLIFIGAGLATLFLGYGLITLVLIFLISNIFSLFLSAFFTYKKFTKPIFDIDYNFCKYLIKTGSPFLLTGIFASIYFYINTILLSMMKGDAVVGWYNAAYNLLGALIPFLSYFMAAMFPVFSRLAKTSGNDLTMAFKESMRYLFIFTLPIVVGTTLIAENIIYFLYGAQFSESISTLQILIWALLFMSMSLVLMTFLNSTDRQMFVTKTTACGAVINVALNILLIPKYSLIGASIATVITEASLFVLYYYFVSKYQHISSIHKIVNKPVIAVLVMSIFVLYLREANIFMIIGIAAFIYIGVLLMIKGFTEDDLKILKKIIKRGT